MTEDKSSSRIYLRLFANKLFRNEGIMSEEIYYCDGCGGVMEFDIATQGLKCPNCGNTQKIKNRAKDIVEHTFTKRKAQSISVKEKTSHTMECKGCGAQVEVAADCTATECPYCGSKYVLAEKQVESIIPDGVLTFQVDKHKAGDIFTKWINRRYLAPGALKNLYEKDKLQGVYVPYWTFDADTICDYHAEGGKNRKVKEKDSNGNEVTKTVTDWYPVHGRVKQFFDDILVKASKNMKGSLLRGVEPYDTKKIVSYQPTYLSGYGAECYTVSLEDAHRDAIGQMETELRSMSRKDIFRKYDEVKNLSVDIDYNDETYKHILLPVYATAYTYKGKNYSVLINGQNGKIKGDYPKSVAKIALIIAIIAAIIGGIIAVKFATADKKDKTNDTGYNVTQESNTYMDADFDLDADIVYEYEV